MVYPRVKVSFPLRFRIDSTTTGLRFIELKSIRHPSAKISRGWIITVAAVSILQPCSLCVCKLLKRSCKARKSPKGGGQRSGREPLNSECNSIIAGILRTFAIPARQSCRSPSFFLSLAKSRIRGNNKRTGETEGKLKRTVSWREERDRVSSCRVSLLRCRDPYSVGRELAS